MWTVRVGEMASVPPGPEKERTAQQPAHGERGMINQEIGESSGHFVMARR
jgi:hypothetical protein